MDYEKRIEEIIRDIAKQNDALKLLFVKFANLITGKKEEYNETVDKIKQKYDQARFLYKTYQNLMNRTDRDISLDLCNSVVDLNNDPVYLLADDEQKTKFEGRKLNESDYWNIIFNQNEYPHGSIDNSSKQLLFRLGKALRLIVINDRGFWDFPDKSNILQKQSTNYWILKEKICEYIEHNNIMTKDDFSELFDNPNLVDDARDFFGKYYNEPIP